MALIKNTVIDKIEVVGTFKHIQVREDKQIIDDDTGEVVVTGKWNRYVLSPDADISDQPTDVQAIANAVWTDDVKAAYTAHVAKLVQEA
tara:strand:+ start:645 stop:911 length:267 start_codon:yes stop_codon:yes gene_type:complete